MKVIYQEKPAEIITTRRRVTIGLPAAASPAERRFPITPEGAAILCERGFEVKMEKGAAETIHFGDEKYRVGGVEIVDRREALACDIVMHLPAISPEDAVCLKPGAILLSLLHPDYQAPMAVRTLLQRHITAIALDLVEDDRSNRPFADILSEVDGRAAIAIASSLLADPVLGKGILLGGVAGVVPCEVTIIGSGIAAQAAAQSAIGLGATVRLFDNDVYYLRSALNLLRHSAVIGSAIHPKVLNSALRSADIIIATPTRQPVEIPISTIEQLKKGVIAFDLSCETNPFKGLRRIDLALASAADCGPSAQAPACYVHAGSAVPRTAAMALSTTLLTFLDEITICDGLPNALKFNPGLSRAAYTFMGKIVNADVARRLGQRVIDISLFLI